jgi:hypothetical protein
VSYNERRVTGLSWSNNQRLVTAPCFTGRTRFSRVSRGAQDWKQRDSCHRRVLPPSLSCLSASHQAHTGRRVAKRETKGRGGARTGLEAEFEDSEAIDRARPKSHTLTRQSELRSMFEGFMSRCSIPAVCMYLSALSSWYMIYCLCTCQRKAATSALPANPKPSLPPASSCLPVHS